MDDKKESGRLDRLEYQIFRIVVFIISVYWMGQLLDKTVHFRQFVSGLLFR
jgi:hypothetical protein